MTALAAISTPAFSQAGEHRWAGLLYDAHTREVSGGVEAWIAEDGGRIRHRDPSTGNWSFQSTPAEVQDTLRRVFFLGNTSTGWAVGQGGWVLKTTNGGTTWNTIGSRIASPVQGGSEPWEELYDIHFLDADDGWMVGKHSVWLTTNGGTSWTALDPKNPDGSSYGLTPNYVELYAIDVIERGDGSRLGLITGQPGVVFRSTDANLASWELVWDVTDLCAATPCGGSTSQLPACACDICPGGTDHPGPWAEMWDIEISHNATSPLAIMGGGVGTICGVIFRSTDDGVTWTPELHECTCPGGSPCIDCSSLPAYNDDPSDPFDLNRHQYYRTVYGVGIFSDNNSAVAAAYNGQHLKRDPSSGVWLDRSIFAAGVPTVPNTVTYPMVGAEALTLGSGTRMGVLTGFGGHLRESTDGGDTYTNRAIGEPHRIKDVFFKDASTGWHVGQFYRIAKSVDGGVSWDEQTPNSSASNQGFLNAAVVAPTTNMEGVTVGDAFTPSGSTTSIPKILYTNANQQVGSPQWIDETITSVGVQILGNPTFMDGKALKEVTWSGDTTFWAVGQGGLILRSTNGGQLWRQVVPESESTLVTRQLEGVAFRDTTTGILVGRRLVSGTFEGFAYQYQDLGGSVSWTELTLPLPTGTSIGGLWDVAISGTKAYAVGEKSVNGDLQGVVLVSDYASGTFGAFSDVTPTAGIPVCETGVDLGSAPVLSEVDIAPSTGDVWVGGACGRLWSRTSAGAWTEEKSGTDAHVVGMSFVANGGSAYGFIGGFRNSQTQQCITRVQ